jgi:hypothetical protein
MSMTNCLLKHARTMKPFDTSGVMDAMRVYQTRGKSEDDANIAAIEDHLRELSADRERIVTDVLAQFKLADPKGYAKLSEPRQTDAFADDFATKRTKVTDTIVVSTKGATEKVKRSNVNSQGNQISNTVSGLRQFWDWYAGSPADAAGKPIVLYHSTAGDISTFETMRETTNTGMFGVPFKSRRAGIFLTPNVRFAEEYSKGKSGSNTMQVYARMQDPADFRHGMTVDLERALKAQGINTRAVLNLQYDWEMFEDEYNGPELVAALKAAGYDGAIINEDDEQGKAQETYVAFDPEQIKSATGNRGSWNEADPDIRRSESRSPAPVYYSQLARAIDDAPARVFTTGKQVAAWLASNASKLGVKKEEIQWTGVTDWLETQGKVTQEQVAEYLKQGGVQVGPTPLTRPTTEISLSEMERATPAELEQMRAGGLTITPPGFMLTDSLREAASAGMPLFSTPRSQIPQMWQDTSKLDAWDNVTRNLQDKLIDTKRIVEEIRKAGIAIKEKFDPYLQETLFHGRAATAVNTFLDSELRPLYVEMAARGFKTKDDLREFDDYLWARHATERNAQIAKIDPNKPDGGSGLTNQQAADVLAGQAVTVTGGRTIQLQSSRMASYAALAARVDRITKNTTDLLISSGLESQETVNKWRATYKNYAPLMRDMESDDNYLGAFNLGMGTGQGFNVKGSSSKRATGSERDVVDVLANIAMQRERAITRAEKNRVSTAVYGLALTAPNPEFWLPINPDSNNPALQQKVEDELVNMGLSRTDAASIAREPTQTIIDRNGMVTQRVNPQLRGRDNVLALRVNGQDRYVFFSSDKRAQNMVRNLKNLDNDQMGEIMSHVAVVTRYFASINTQFNPVFGLTNGIRDLGTGMLNLSSTPLKGQRKRVLAYAWSALRGVYADLRDHRAGRAPTSTWAIEFEEFAKEGGQTGYRDMFRTSEDRAKSIAEEIKNAGKGKSWVALDEKRSPIFGWLSDYNTSIENAIRLAAYKVAKEDGHSVQQAANIAKNLTVNFNKKGLAATQTGAMYAFFNAAVQGTARIGTTMVKRDSTTGKVTMTDAGKKIAYGGVMFGVMQALMLSLAGYDDEEPPQFIREKSIIIPMGYRGKYIAIPMPLGFHVIANIGRIPTEWMLNGFRKPGERLTQFLRVIMDAFNPVGSSTMLQTLTPTVVDPLAALAENKDWSGKNIYKEDFSKLEPTAGWTRTKDTASPVGKWMSYAINYVSGGGQYGIGLASPTPDQIDYLVGQATGGVGRETMKLTQFGTSMASGESLPIRKIPVVGRFAGDTTGQESEMGKFYDNLRRIGEHDSTLKEIKRAKDSQAYADYMRKNPEARMVKMADKAQRDINLLKQQKRDAIEKKDSERVKQIERQLTSRVGYYNKQLEGK